MPASSMWSNTPNFMAGFPSRHSGAREARARNPYSRIVRVLETVQSSSGAGIMDSGFLAALGPGMTARTPSLPLQLDDLVRLGASRRDDLDLGAFLLADQGAGERRGDGDPALLGVGFRLADDLPHRLLVGVLIDQGDGGAKGDGVAGQFRHVDDLGARQLVLELGDAALVERLRFLRRVILGVLRKIAVGARIGNLLDDARALSLLAMLELGLECRIARRRHGNFIHCRTTSKRLRGA